jgi:hypothetical protein
MNDNAALNIRQFCEAWRIMCTAAPGYRLASDDGVEYIFSGLPFPFFNAAIVNLWSGIRV